MSEELGTEKALTHSPSDAALSHQHLAWQLEGNLGTTDVLPSQFAHLSWSKQASPKPGFLIHSVGFVCPWNVSCGAVSQPRPVPLLL